MQIKLTLASTLLASTLIGGAALAGNTGEDMKDDMMNGHGMVRHTDQVVPAIPGASPRQELKDDIVYSGKTIESHGIPPVPAVAGADNHDDNGSMMHN